MHVHHGVSTYGFRAHWSTPAQFPARWIQFAFFYFAEEVSNGHLVLKVSRYGVQWDSIFQVA